MIYKQLDFYSFCDELANAGFISRFSDDAIELIFNYFEEQPDDYELDVDKLYYDLREEQIDAAADMLDMDYCAGVTIEQVTAALSKHTTVLGVTDDTVVFFTY